MAKVCVADLEADGLLDEATRVHCGVFKDISTGEITKFTEYTLNAMFKFMNECDALIMHNGIGYDWPLLRKLYNYEYKGKKVDTLLMSRLQRPNRTIPKGCRSPHSVEAWGVRFGRAKPEHEDWSVFSPEMMHRCTEDVEIQHRIYLALVEEGREHNWADAHRLTHKLFEILEKQEEYGWLLDQEYSRACIARLTHWMDRIDKVLRDRLPHVCVRPVKNKGVYQHVKKPFKQSGEYVHHTAKWMQDCGLTGRCVVGPYSKVDFKRVDLGSNTQTKTFLIQSGWKPRDWNFKDGERTSPKLKHDEPFEGVDGGMGRLMARRVQCRHRRSQIEGWFKILRPDGRVPQSISGIAATGRLTHKGIVNIPGGGAFFGHSMRRCFISKPGYTLVGVDSAGCQNRMLAARVGDPAFTKTLIEGKKEDKTSIHYVNQQAIAAIAGLDVTYKICKNLNYAFMFGAQDTKLAQTAGVSVQMGAMIRKALLSVSPGFAALVESLEEQWKATAKKRMRWGKLQYYDGWITGLDGRPIMIDKEHCILVYMLQSDEAIMMQVALCFLYSWLCKRGYTHGVEYGFVANVHDEFQIEVRDDLVEEIAALGRKAIAHAGEFLEIACPHKGESDIGKSWADTH